MKINISDIYDLIKNDNNIKIFIKEKIYGIKFYLKIQKVNDIYTYSLLKSDRKKINEFDKTQNRIYEKIINFFKNEFKREFNNKINPEYSGYENKLDLILDIFKEDLSNDKKIYLKFCYIPNDCINYNNLIFYKIPKNNLILEDIFIVNKKDEIETKYISDEYYIKISELFSTDFLPLIYELESQNISNEILNKIVNTTYKINTTEYNFNNHIIELLTGKFFNFNYFQNFGLQFLIVHNGKIYTSDVKNSNITITKNINNYFRIFLTDFIIFLNDNGLQIEDNNDNNFNNFNKMYLNYIYKIFMLYYGENFYKYKHIDVDELKSLNLRSNDLELNLGYLEKNINNFNTNYFIYDEVAKELFKFLISYLRYDKKVKFKNDIIINNNINNELEKIKNQIYDTLQKNYNKNLELLPFKDFINLNENFNLLFKTRGQSNVILIPLDTVPITKKQIFLIKEVYKKIKLPVCLVLYENNNNFFSYDLNNKILQTIKTKYSFIKDYFILKKFTLSNILNQLRSKNYEPKYIYVPSKLYNSFLLVLNKYQREGNYNIQLIKISKNIIDNILQHHKELYKNILLNDMEKVKDMVDKEVYVYINDIRNELSAKYSFFLPSVDEQNSLEIIEFKKFIKNKN